MWKFTVLLMCLIGYCVSGPVGQKRNMPIVQQRYENAAMIETEPVADADPNGVMIMSTLSLPSNATSIRADITDGFSCENKTYGYYADVDNDCQIFHVCLPVTYPDGKENTFRWSFICPEDTIFSQDSFTCMRPDDMTITCEESYQYYELNRNFGIVDSAADKENSNEAASVTVEGNETVAEVEVPAEVTKPVVQDEDEKLIAQSKPVNVLRPSRRKPSISFGAQKKPAVGSYPLRKMPQAQVQPQISDSTVTKLSDDAKETANAADEDDVKPTLTKFSRRPIPVMHNSFKEKIPNTNTESLMSTRTEFFNQNKKRPYLFDRRPPEQSKDENPAEQPKIESESTQHNFSPLASELPISNTETQVADTETEASENTNIFVKPEEDANNIPQKVENTNKAAEEPIKVLEAFEEIPAVLSEVVETPNGHEDEISNVETLTDLNEKPNMGDEPQITEEVHSAEDTHADEEISIYKVTQPFVKTPNDVQAAKETQNILENETVDEAKPFQETETPVETDAVQQSLRTSAEEIQTIVEHKVAEDIQTVEKAAEVQESQNAGDVQKTAIEMEIPAQTQVAEETPMTEEHELVEEIKTVSGAMDTPTSEDTSVGEEIDRAKEIQTSEQIDTAEEMQAAEKAETFMETEASREIKTAEETQAPEVEISEIQQKLRTSAEGIENSEETLTAEENRIAQTAEEVPAAAQTEAINETQSAEDTPEVQDVSNDEKIQTLGDTQLPQEVQNNEESEGKVPEEALEVEEPQPIVHKVEESNILEEPSPHVDSVEENVEPGQVSATNDSEKGISENANSAESITAASMETVQDMHSEKLIESDGSMQSTGEVGMSETMYENMETSKQSAGGFKPVDPVMAHEAEQLIVDFINTLRKNDFTNETPGMHVEHEINEVSGEEELHQNDEVEEAERVESNEETQEENVKLAEDNDQVGTSETQAVNVEDKNQESQGVYEVDEYKQESDATEEEANDLNALKSLETQRTEDITESQKSKEVSAEAMSLPQDMYQIPVKVIAAPVAEMPVKEEQSLESEIEPNLRTPSTEEKSNEETPSMSLAGYKPLSIDDIVELVKERLDHMPKDEMDTPMQLEQVIGEAQEDKTANNENVEQFPISAEEQQQTSHSVEEIVMPIYQRTVQPAQIETGVQTESSEQIPDEEQFETSDDTTDVKEKTKRSYRSNSMLTPKVDSRKRRFLFKADSS